MENNKLVIIDEKLEAELKELVNIKSINSYKAEVDKLNTYFKKLLKEVPLKWLRYKSKNNGNLLVANSIKNNRNSPNILLSGHGDIVLVNNLKYSKYLKSKNNVFGPGVSDMKGGLITIVWLIRNLYLNGLLNNLTLTLVPDEETGSQEYKNILSSIYKKQDYALVFESTHEMFGRTDIKNLVTNRKGVAIIKIVITGKASHSGITSNKKDRKSSNIEMAHKILQIEKLANYKKGTTLNVGLVKGGTSVNTISDSTEIQFDVRYKTNLEMERVIKSLITLCNHSVIKGTKSTISYKVIVPPMNINKKTKIMLNNARIVANKMKIKLLLEKRSGASDGNQIAQYGAGVIDGFGPISKGGHTNNESLYLPSIKKSVEFAFNLIKILSNS